MNVYHGLALVAGLLLPLQIAFNNRLTLYTGNATTSSLISFLVGTCALLAFSVSNLNNFQKSFQNVGQAPWYAWIGGLVGAFYIISTIVASPKIGIAMFIVLIIGGQLLMSTVVDHFGLLGAPIKPFDWMKGLGLVLIMAGIVLIKK